MAPKVTKSVPAAGLAQLKARLEAQKKAEEEEKKRIEDEKRKFEEEERLLEEQRKFDQQEKERLKEQEKEDKLKEKNNAKRYQQLEALIRMKLSGMQIPMTPELEEFEKEYMEEQNKKKLKKQQEQEKIKKEEDENLIKKSVENEEKNEREGEKSDQEEEINTNLRSPIFCVLGHVDAGKTSLLDKLRSTNVQKNEHGNITQQIGASYFPRSSLLRAIKKMPTESFDVTIPGVLMLDTPGHESFANLRNRGSSICDIAILVVDIAHGLEKQTRESLRLLRQKKCPFIVALNKVDKLFDWQKNEDMDIRQTFSLQKPHVLAEFETKLSNIKLQLAEEGINSELYYDNKDDKRVVSIVPLSAKTGEGIVDLIYLKIKLVQQYMETKISFKDDLQCTILEVKPVQGFGMTMDVILVNGILNHNDNIILCGINGPIVTRIKSLLTPQPLKELRVKGEYVLHESIKAAHCVKIAADGLEEVVPGTSLYVANTDEEIEKYKQEVDKDVGTVMNNLSKDKIGVTVQSSTLGSLEALLSFLNEMKIPVGCISLGPIHKKHINHTILMKSKSPKYACMLAFDVPVSTEAKMIAEKEGVKIYNANIIYHLFDSFTKHVTEYDEMIREKNKSIAIFPCSLQVLSCFRAKDPLVIGCRVLDGQVRIGTMLYKKDGGDIGKILGMQINNKDIEIGKKGMDIAIKLEGKTSIKEKKMEDGKQVEVERTQLLNYGRHFGENDILNSKISRKSIDALKESFRDDMSNDDWKLIIELKKELNIV
jgi:translation initiation factor 5B